MNLLLQETIQSKDVLCTQAVYTVHAYTCVYVLWHGLTSDKMYIKFVMSIYSSQWGIRVMWPYKCHHLQLKHYGQREDKRRFVQSAIHGYVLSRGHWCNCALLLGAFWVPNIGQWADLRPEPPCCHDSCRHSFILNRVRLYCVYITCSSFFIVYSFGWTQLILICSCRCTYSYQLQLRCQAHVHGGSLYIPFPLYPIADGFTEYVYDLYYAMGCIDQDTNTL